MLKSGGKAPCTKSGRSCLKLHSVGSPMAILSRPEINARSRLGKRFRFSSRYLLC